jgi:hypothetical protein
MAGTTDLASLLVHSTACCWAACGLLQVLKTAALKAKTEDISSVARVLNMDAA